MRHQSCSSRITYRSVQFYTFGLTQYDVAIFLDIDTLVLRSLDDAIAAFAARGSWMAAVDEWNKDVCMKLPPDYINTGVFFTRPHELIFAELVHTKEHDTEWPCRYANQVKARGT